MYNLPHHCEKNIGETQRLGINGGTKQPSQGKKNFQEANLQKFIVQGQAKQYSVSDQALFFFRLVNKIPAGKGKRKADLRLPSLINTFKIIVLMPICIIIVFLIYFPCST